MLYGQLEEMSEATRERVQRIFKAMTVGSWSLFRSCNDGTFLQEADWRRQFLQATTELARDSGLPICQFYLRNTTKKRKMIDMTFKGKGEIGKNCRVMVLVDGEKFLMLVFMYGSLVTWREELP